MKSTWYEDAPIKPNKEASPLKLSKVIAIFRSASDALFAQAELHCQLAAVEWVSEKKRVTQLLIISLFGFSCFLGLLFSVSVLAMVLSWNTSYQLVTILLLCAVYAIGTYFAWQRFARLANSAEAFFPGMRAELAADIAALRGRLQ